MSDEVVKHLRELSIADGAEHASGTAPIHAVAGLDLALASLRELIGQYAEERSAAQRYNSVHHLCVSWLSE